MLEKMKSAWRIPELRKKIIYTFGMLLVYRLLCVIPVPGINVSAVASAVKDYSILDFMNMMTGGSFQNMSIMAMGITPYINSSIILQLLTVAIPALEKLANEGPEGRKKINEYTRYLTVVLAFIQAVGLVFAMRANSYGGVWYLVIGLSMAAGSALAMWIGERITENGIGNGISLLIMAGIVSNMFNWGRQATVGMVGGTVHPIAVIVIVIALLAGNVLPLTPVLILWMNMATSATLSFGLAFEAAERNVMNRPPRKTGQHVMDGFAVWRVAFVGSMIAIAAFILEAWLAPRGHSPEFIRTVLLQMLVTAQWVYMINCRSSDSFSLSMGLLRNKGIWLVTGVLLLMQLVIIYVPLMQSMFGTEALPLRYWFVTLVIGVAMFLVVEIEKRLTRRFRKTA